MSSLYEDKIHSLARQLNFVVKQRNSCRMFGPRRDLDMSGYVPEPRSEVFVGRLPPDALEDEIYPYFSTVGEIFKIKMIVNINSSNKGFCFVEYMSADLAARAVMLLNQSHFRKSHVIAVNYSTDHKQLLIRNTGIGVTEHTIITVRV